MIVINKALAGQAVDNAISSTRVNENSSPKAYLIQANVHLNRVYDASDTVDRRLPKYSERQVAAAETIHWLLAYLHRLRCPDIEQLLRDVAAYRKAHPDYPKGSWPW